MVQQGRAAIIKKVTFKNELNEIVVKNELIAYIEAGDIVGEEELWYNRANTYSSRVISHDFKAYSISNEDFEKNFGKVIQPSKSQFDCR